jgi:transposase-like protein
LPVSGPIIPPAREGHRRRFSEADKRQILEEAIPPGARFAPGANVSSTIRALSSCDQRRRRSNPPKTSTRIA